MARLLFIIPLVVIGVVAIVLAVRELTDSAEVTEGSQPGATVGGARTVRVRIEDDRFRPANVSVSAGQTVRWVNADDSAHTVTSTPSSDFRFRSGKIPSGEVFEQTFEEIGVFRFRGDVGPQMSGKVTVLSD